MAIVANGAVQVTSAAAAFSIPALDMDPRLRRYSLTVYLQNLGPNAIYAGFAAADTTTAKGVQIAASGGALAIDLRPDQSLYLIAATADQTTPADTRYMVVAAT